MLLFGHLLDISNLDCIHKQSKLIYILELAKGIIGFVNAACGINTPRCRFEKVIEKCGIIAFAALQGVK